MLKHLNKLKRPLTIILILTSLISCEDNPNAFQCVLVTKDATGSKLSVDQFYFHCSNSNTGEKRNIAIYNADKCIDNALNECKWVATDLKNFEKIKKYYKEQCK